MVSDSESVEATTFSNISSFDTVPFSFSISLLISSNVTISSTLLITAETSEGKNGFNITLSKVSKSLVSS